MTVLARQLAEGVPERRPTALDAFKLARKKFIAGQRIEMQTLAADLGTSRVTLHRWVGSRDLLIGEIVWSLAEPTLREARKASRKLGGAGIAETIERFIEIAQAAPFMRGFVEREPEMALRVLTTKRSPYQGRVVETIRGMLEEEVEAGRVTPPMDLDDLAYVLVRLGESFFYTDLIAGKQPDAHKARQAIAALLR